MFSSELDTGSNVWPFWQYLQEELKKHQLKKRKSYIKKRKK